MELPIETVLERMYGEKEYRSIDLDTFPKTITGKKVYLEGSFLEYMFDEKLEIEFGIDEEEPVTLQYSPQLGMSERDLEIICKLFKENRFKARVYGEVAIDEDNTQYKVIQIHKIEIDAFGTKQQFPNVDMIENMYISFPEIDDFVRFQDYEKQVAKEIANAKDEGLMELALKSKAQLALYNAFSNFREKLYEKMQDEMPEISIVSKEEQKNDISALLKK